MTNDQDSTPACLFKRWHGFNQRTVWVKLCDSNHKSERFEWDFDNMHPELIMSQASVNDDSTDPDHYCLRVPGRERILDQRTVLNVCDEGQSDSLQHFYYKSLW